MVMHSHKRPPDGSLHLPCDCPFVYDEKLKGSSPTLCPDVLHFSVLLLPSFYPLFFHLTTPVVPLSLSALQPLYPPNHCDSTSLSSHSTSFHPSFLCFVFSSPFLPSLCPPTICPFITFFFHCSQRVSVLLLVVVIISFFPSLYAFTYLTICPFFPMSLFQRLPALSLSNSHGTRVRIKLTSTS